MNKGFIFSLILISVLTACGPNDKIDPQARILSLDLCSDGQRVVLAYQKDNAYYAWVEGKVQGPYDLVYYPRYSSHSPYPVLVTWQKDKQWYVNFGDQKYGPYSYGGTAPEIEISSMNDISVAYRENGLDYYQFNEYILGPFDKAGGWVFSPTQGHYAFWFVQDTNFMYSVDGNDEVAGPEYQAPFFLTDDSMGLIRSVQHKLYLSIYNRDLGPFDFVLPPVFNSRGDDYALLCDQDGKNYIITSRTRKGPFENIQGSPLFSPDGKSLAYITSSGQGSDRTYTLILDDKSYGPYRYISQPRWSDSGRRVAWLAWTSTGMMVTLDGQEYGPWPRWTDVKFKGEEPLLASVSNHQVFIQSLDAKPQE